MKTIVGNLKTYLNGSEIKEYLNKLDKSDNLIICPSSIHIPYFLNKNIKIGLQNIYFKDGAFTGEVSALQGKNLGVSYVLIGHSERKKYFNETNDIINLKIKESLKNNLNVILCIGETKEEKDCNLTTKILKHQLDECLNGINDPVIIAYEPVWSIGTGNIPSNEEINNIIKFIKNIYPYKVLYGGSINKENIEHLNNIDNLDGYLIGAASSKVDEFNYIIDVINKR